jgi:hypothetical protein
MQATAVLMALLLAAPPSAASPSLPTPLLPGQNDFVFTMYGCPGEVEELKELVVAMKDKGLGNGFDPGPSARASSRPLFEYLATVGWPIVCYPGWSDMQVKEGRSRLADADEESLKVLDHAGVFNAIQLGEWGYYFHNLSSVESWWRDVYGAEYDEYKHLSKPLRLKGYDVRPASRRECYETLRDYFQTRDRFMRGRTISVTGHSHYEAYAGEWGTRVIGLELGENIAFTQSKIAFARGASRQWQTPLVGPGQPVVRRLLHHQRATTEGRPVRSGPGRRALAELLRTHVAPQLVRRCRDGHSGKQHCDLFRQPPRAVESHCARQEGRRGVRLRAFPRPRRALYACGHRPRSPGWLQRVPRAAVGYPGEDAGRSGGL